MKRVEKLVSGGIYADLAGALSTGLCTGTLVWMITSMSDSKLSLMMWVQSVTIAVACYTVSNVLLHKLWTGHLRRMFPTWLLTAALGTFLFICITVVPDAIAAWGSPQRVEATLSEFILVRLEDARSVFIAFGFIALLIMATFHYAKKMAAEQAGQGPVRLKEILDTFDKIKAQNGFHYDNSLIYAGVAKGGINSSFPASVVLRETGYSPRPGYAARQIAGCNTHIFDGVNYVVEINKDKTYRTYLYDNPSYSRCAEAKQMLKIGEIIAEEFNLREFKIEG